MFYTIKKILLEKNIISLMTSITGALLGLAAFMILTRTLDKKIFGDWVLYTTLTTFIDLIRFGLTRNALVRFVSGIDEKEKKDFMGSGYIIGLTIVIFLSITLWPAYLIIESLHASTSNGYVLFLLYYPLLALTNLSWNNALSLFQAEQRFKDILIIRTSSLGTFVLFLFANILFFQFGIHEIIVAQIITNLMPSIFVAIKKWDGLSYMSRSNRRTRKKIIDFGKFSMGTLIGASLLRSADTFIIGMSPFLGSEGIAKYAIPLKITDLLAIPLQSFTITAFPKMSKQSLLNDIEGLKKTFYAYTGAITILFIPVSLIGFIFAEQLVWLLGGNEYAASVPLLAAIFRIFALYSLLLPIDRFTGVMLDSINKPKYNFYKTIIMATANITGDLIAVFWLHSLQAVAWVTVLFTITGIISGYLYLNKHITLKISNIMTEGVEFYKNIKKYMRPV
jgi:O-antigen/teichoic acid export membrane protein